MVKEYKRGEGAKISENFNSNEFDCHCYNPDCKVTVVDMELVEKLEKLRQTLGTPLRITSGYRCSEYQKELRMRGYETAKGPSQHELGKAADVTNGVALGIELEDCAKQAGFKAIGVGKHFIHCDLRDDCDRRWTYSY